MSLSGNHGSGNNYENSKPLPLFRPEAILNQQQKSYGQIILIRPLSLMVLSWLALAIVAVPVGFLLLGHYTEMAFVPGVVLPMQHSTAGNQDPQAEFYFPSRWAELLKPGTQLSVRCKTCSPELARQSATVLTVSSTPLNPAPQTSLKPENLYRVTVSLPPQAAFIQLSEIPQTRRVEAEVPLGRKPLIQWFFERS